MLNGKLVLGYCPVGNGNDIFPFDKIFEEKRNIASDGFDDVDCVVFWGGEDIHPSLYNEDAHPFNQSRGKYPSSRDEFEWKAMSYCRINDIPMIGVCRGAQMMCAKAGGFLIQDVSGHGSQHTVKTLEGEVFGVTSCHHQMMYPFDVEHELIAWSTNNMSRHYGGAKGVDLALMMQKRVEPEIVYFPRLNGLAIQGHPEWAQEKSRFVEYTNQLIRSKLLQNVLV